MRGIGVRISLSVGQGFVRVAVEEGVRLSLSKFSLGMKPGQTLSRSGLLAAIQSVEGVASASIDLPVEDVPVKADETARIHSVSLT